MNVKHGCFYILIAIFGFIIGCQEPSARRTGGDSPSPQAETKKTVYPFDSSRGCYVDSIVNGAVASPNSPIKKHVVMLITYYKHNAEVLSTLCTGTLVDRNTVLTAAHCLPRNRVATKIIASINLFCSSGFDQNLVYPALEVNVHPQYRFEQKPSVDSPDFDIALVKFEGILPPDYMPLPLQKVDIQSEMQNPSSQMMMVGYGRTGTNDTSLPELRYLTKPWKQLVLMRESVNLVERLNLLSVNQSDARGGCSGDSGGPLLAEVNGSYKILGVASYIESTSEVRLCEQGQIYYSYITSYWDWIREQML